MGMDKAGPGTRKLTSAVRMRPCDAQMVGAEPPRRRLGVRVHRCWPSEEKLVLGGTMRSRNAVMALAVMPTHCALVVLACMWPVAIHPSV